MKIRFGKFKGHKIEEIPSNYLKWLATNINDEEKGEQSICLNADKEYRYRSETGTHFEEGE